MTSKLNDSQATMQGKLDVNTTKIGSAAILEIRDGTQPAGPDTTATGNIGASFTLGTPFAAGASAAIPSVLTVNLPSNVNGGGTGFTSGTLTPTWWRIKTSGGVAIKDGSAGAAGCDMTIGTITFGQPVSISQFAINSGGSGH